MDYFYWYQKVLLYVVRLMALMFVAVSAILSIAILADLLFDLHWGYPWWSILLTLAWIVLGYLVYRAATTAQRRTRPKAME